MLVEVKVPILAESIADATLLAWNKQAGEAVKRGENLIDLETDKVTLEVPAPSDGVLAEIRKQEGETAVSDEVLAVIDTEAAASAEAQPAPAVAATAAPDAQAAQAAPPPTSPAVRKLLEENRLEQAAVPATGPQGRLTKSDVLSRLEGQATAPAEAPAQPGPAPSPAHPSGERAEQRVPMTRLRRRAAERLLEAQHTNALLTTFNEVDMQPVMDLRARYREDFEARHGVRLGFMSFFAKAAIEALKKFPVVNASVDGEDLVYHGYYDMGIAVSSPRGLVVPVVRDADLLSFAELEGAIAELGRKARESQLSIEDLTGGTFTITNGGVFGSLVSTPIINPPQSAILGMHKIQDRPMAVQGQVVVRPMMYLALTYDHRIIDGREAVQFLVTIKEQLEDPARMLLQV